jgi:hypothetical protein
MQRGEHRQPWYQQRGGGSLEIFQKFKNCPKPFQTLGKKMQRGDSQALMKKVVKMDEK